MNRLAAHLTHFSSLAHSAARDFIQDEDGVTVVEIILVLVVLISLVVIFRKQPRRHLQKAAHEYRQGHP